MNKVKRIIALLAVVTMVFSFTACAGPTTTVAELVTSSEAPEPSSGSYENNYEGLIKYLKDCEVIAGEGSPMSADFIGAEKGEKFLFKYLEATMSCEIYEFNTDVLSEKAKETLDNVKKTGKFTALDKEVDAVLSNNGKFMMIFVNGSKDEAYVKFAERINDKFKNFK